MSRNMKKWLEDMRLSPVKKALPLLSFPSISLMGISVKELVFDSDAQANGMKLVSQRIDSAAAVSFMDLSVEAECFGSAIRITDGEVPTVVGAVVTDEDEANALEVPKVGSARSGIYVEAVRKAAEMIKDRPVFAGVIGPFSLAARLLDVNEIMIDCYEEPELVNIVLEKAAEFIISYSKAFKEAGADGIVLAEPVAGVLSPVLCAEFSTPYVKRIVDSVTDDNFIVIYHNCGNNVYAMADSILETGASAYHFGNAVDMKKMLEAFPEDVVIMGNIDPVSQFCSGTPESIRQATLELMERCAVHQNFVISSGCDIPPLSSWDNIRAFFDAVGEFYGK